MEATQEDIDEAYRVMYEAEDALYKKARLSNDRLMGVLSRVKGKKWVRGLHRAIEDCEVYGVIRITRRAPNVRDWQKVNYGPIKGMWVRQWSVGTEGDSWEGIIWVQIVEGRWLEMMFSC